MTPDGRCRELAKSYRMVAGIINIVLGAVCAAWGIIFTAFFMMMLQGTVSIHLPILLTLSFIVLSFLAFGLGLAGSISSFKHSRFGLALSGSVVIIIWAALFIQIDFLAGVHFEMSLLFLGLSIMLLAVVATAFLTESKKDFVSAR